MLGAQAHGRAEKILHSGTVIRRRAQRQVILHVTHIHHLSSHTKLPLAVHEYVVEDGAQPGAHAVCLLQAILPAQGPLDAILHQIIRFRRAPYQPRGIAAQRRQVGNQILRENGWPPSPRPTLRAMG
jgi:hypothetical protein